MGGAFFFLIFSAAEFALGLVIILIQYIILQHLTQIQALHTTGHYMRLSTNGALSLKVRPPEMTP